ncbi:ATP-dependent protease La [Lachnospiraceae bacterium MD308]|nr:ATP-dependent protease La [Lachnospiraceae bacterium MD308]
MENNTKSLPMIPLRELTVLPEMVIHFDVSREKSIAAIERAMEEQQKLFLTTQKKAETDEPGIEDVYETGCIATIKQIIKLPKRLNRILIAVDERARLNYIEDTEQCLMANVTVVEDIDTLAKEIGADKFPMNVEAMILGLKELFKEYTDKNPKVYKELASQIGEISDLKKLVDVIAANFPLPYIQRQELLEEVNLMRRYDMLVAKIVHEVQVQSIKEELQSKVKRRVDKNQREYILREEIRLIREELGDDSTISDADEFAQAVDKLQSPDEVKQKISKEIKRFRSIMNSPSETGVIRTYIETMLEMPWDKVCKEHKDIKYAKKVLDEDHYGLEKVKERILEYMAVRALTKKGDSPILCLAGPPGTGKTSIAKSLARALKRPYVRISLGGVRDEAEIRGHRKTYVGAMPGRIADALRSAKVKNPLMLLDEIDKVSNDYKGDTFSALLEVLDSEQNKKFRDHYLEVPLDLSEVLFVTTANTLQTIPRPLLDRMEVIEVSSYTENEKLHIAQEHLIPKQMERHGLKKKQLSVSKKAIWKIARSYTKEAGVRQLERKLADICRKAAKEIFEEKKSSVHVTERNIHQYLGKELYIYQMANETDEVGIVRGLAWTSVGGDTLQIEVNIMPGEGEILLTGQLGDVMKESARTGISYIRSVGKSYKISEEFFKEHDVHIHIPEGAVPKDGPSAGITMATAILSAVTGKKVRADVAMTGEITLRGRVLPIGGLKEKLLAAKNAGIRTVVVPAENMPDIEEISSEITKGLDIVPVSHMNEVLKTALVKPKK